MNIIFVNIFKNKLYSKHICPEIELQNSLEPLLIHCTNKGIELELQNSV